MPIVGTGSKKESHGQGSAVGAGNETRAGHDLIGGPPLPSSGDAEQGLLAACILDQTGETISMCSESGLQPEHFYSPSHQLIYSALLDLQREGEPADEILLAEKLSKLDKLEEVGGHAALASLAGRIETPVNAPHWLKIVMEKQTLRECIRVGYEIIDRSHKQDGELTSFLGEIQESVFQLGQDRTSGSTTHFGDYVSLAGEQIERMLSKEGPDGVKTGFRDLDDLTNGFKPGEMIVLAARPSVGKTSFAMNVVENCVLSLESRQKPPNVLVFSLEMSAVSLALRLICGRAQVNQNQLQRGRPPSGSQKKLADAGSEFKNAPIWVDDSGGITIHQLRAKARRIHSRQALSLVVVDYLQLIRADSRIQSREAGVADISRGLKAMAKELEVPVVVLSQLNRESEKDKREPRLSDLRESGSIEQDADVVMLLAKNKIGSDVRDMDDPEAEEGGDAEDFEPVRLILAKQRNGPTGHVNLAFRRKYTQFTSMDYHPRMS